MSVQGISVAGLGKLGTCMAVAFAHKGHKVVGVDVSPKTIEAVNRGESHIYEPGLAGLFREVRDRLRATADYRDAIENSQVTFVVVPTPSCGDGRFSTEYVEQAAREIAACLRQKNGFHTIVLTSTVLPGATRGTLKPLLEEVSGKICGIDFGLCYSPELIALGSVIRDFCNPDLIMIGESDPRSGKMLARIYQTLCDNSPPIVRTTFENAELAKIAVNSFVTMKISFANTLAAMCERLPTANVDVVTGILGLDSRIGAKYLKGALGFGGPCFPRDNKAFASLARRLGCQARLAEATDEVNESQVARLLQRIVEVVGTPEGKKIAILGLAYKPDTDVIEESQSVAIAHCLLKEGARLSVYDPGAMRSANGVLGPHVEYAASVTECLQGAELCLLATPWQEFNSLRPEECVAAMKRPAFLDCWRLFKNSDSAARLEYLGVGLGPE